MDNETFAEISASAVVKNQYQRQLDRVAKSHETEMIEEAVAEVLGNLPQVTAGSLVIYGDPQSGKTEMMICLTAALLDSGHRTIVHLMNDSLELLTQNLDRFKPAGLAPAPRGLGDLSGSPLVPAQAAVVFCKKNARDLAKLITHLQGRGPVVVIDDEADYATPNAKINQNDKTKINALVTALLGADGTYVGVTATPARLNLNNTFDNKPEKWAQFRPHSSYTGQDVFFPQNGAYPYRLTLLPGPATTADARRALARFLVSVAHLNTHALSSGGEEEYYSFLVHTSAKTQDHAADRQMIESAIQALVDPGSNEFKELVALVFSEAQSLYPADDPKELAKYVVENASRYSIVVLNSKRDRDSAGAYPTLPTCPFTVIVGGNIVSRGVTFPNLLSMFFTRDVKTKMQQDTYIQRARMFGSRGKYLDHFELTIPQQLYADWHRCFDFHRLALAAIKNNNVSPVWVGDTRISIAASSSIDRGTVDLSKGEMSFQMFDFKDQAKYDSIVLKDPMAIESLEALAAEVGDAIPPYLIDYLKAELATTPGCLAIHTAGTIANYTSADQDTISRRQGFLGTNQLESKKFPNAVHHVKMFHNGKNKARVFYKGLAGVQFIQNLKV